eukprot:bmy_20819T0
MNASIQDNGEYRCQSKGAITSDPVYLDVISDSTPAPQSKYFWLQFLIPFLVKILFVVDTWLFISTQQQFTFLLKIKRTRKGNRLMDPQPRPEPPKN